jgi:phenylpropionate dioxygenase-like ring-hydroxylating dioxygenase large terminal subunit
MSADLETLLRFMWHPVCTLDELVAAKPGGVGPISIMLLGERLVVAMVGGSAVVLRDRCVHRSTALSVGTIEADGIRCAYHGWVYAPDGQCIEIPAMPNGPIPSRACVESFASQIAYGLVWVCLDNRAALPLPACPAFGDPTLRVAAGMPYTWPVSPLRRVENFVDLSHFAFVHDGSLGSRNEPVPPLPDINRAPGELHFNYDPPDIPVEGTAMFGHSKYRMPMPCTVNIEFFLASGARRVLWMTGSPVTTGSCRAFWFIARSDAWDEPDADHMAFQDRVLAEDEPVVVAQNPGEMVLDAGFELSVRTDKVSIEYRRWLRELTIAADVGPAALRAALLLEAL